MNNSICGIDCSKCDFKKDCKGCIETNAHPFGGECIIANCCNKNKYSNCNICKKNCNLKQQLIKEFNSLGIKDMEKVTNLNALNGSFVNLKYKLPNGKSIKLLDDKKIYLGNQLIKGNSDRCYGIIGDEEYLLVCEYGIDGVDAEIIIYKKR